MKAYVILFIGVACIANPIVLSAQPSATCAGVISKIEQAASAAPLAHGRKCPLNPILS